MDLNLKGKIALVTGASRGLGFATARLLAQEGAIVYINSRKAEKLNAAAQIIAKETGKQVHTIPGDVTDPATPQKLIDKVIADANGLDLLVANAGGPPAGTFESIDDAAWQKAIDLSFMCQVRLIRAALPHLKKSAAASVLTITSYSAKQPIPGLVTSSSIRAATIGLTKTLALEMGSQGIRFNSILPGWTETERINELMSHRAEQNKTSIEEEIRKQAQESPLGRIGKPEEFANAAVFLLSPAAAYITGVMLNVDGGLYKGTF